MWLLTPVLLAILWCVLVMSYQPLDWLVGMVLGTISYIAGRLLLPEFVGTSAEVRQHTGLDGPGRIGPVRYGKVRISMWHFFLFLLRAFLDMFLSAFAMIPRVFSGNMEVREFSVPLRLRHAFIRLGLANAITISPGTIAVEMEKDSVLVIAMVKKNEEGSSAQRDVSRLLRCLQKAEGGAE